MIKRVLSLGPILFVLGLIVLVGCSLQKEPANPVSQTDVSKIAAADCSHPDWDPAVSYSKNDHVTHNNHEWIAKKNNTNIEPGTNNAYWRDLGVCGGDPPPPPPPPPGCEEPTPIQIFGVWHAGDHYCDWALPIDMNQFDSDNHWLIDRGDGRPSVNLVVLSFLQPLQVLNMSAGDPTTGVPVGMTQDVVNYFKNEGIRVMMSIGGVTYTDYWTQALATNATQFGLNAAAIASYFGVGIEIDYEEGQNPDLIGLQAFVDAYRSVHPYDATGANHAARLTIDLAAGGRYLIDLNRYATINWLDNANPVLDYANAMVARDSGDPADWQEHVDGKPQYGPPIPPKAPNRFTGGLYLKGNLSNCTNFASSEQNEHADYVMNVAPNGAGTTCGMLGYMFWAAGTPSARKNYVSTYPPNSCEGGMGVAATTFDIPIPMPPLRQE